MATPLGHMLAGAAATAVTCRRTQRRGWLLVVGALVGASPDLDFLPGLLIGDAARFHHGLSHSLALAVVVACLAWIVASRDRGTFAIGAGSAYASHLLLDALSHDPSPPVGIPLFWPVSDVYVISPITPLPRVFHTDRSPISLHNFGVALLELVLFGFLLWVCVRICFGNVRSNGAD